MSPSVDTLASVAAHKPSAPYVILKSVSLDARVNECLNTSILVLVKYVDE
jgi:hypothetical protein